MVAAIGAVHECPAQKCAKQVVAELKSVLLRILRERRFENEAACLRIPRRKSTELKTPHHHGVN